MSSSLFRMIHPQSMAFCLLSLSWAISHSVLAGDCAAPVAEIVSVQGVVETRSSAANAWRLVRQQDRFCPGDHLRVRANSRAGLHLKNQTFLRLGEQTSVSLTGFDEESSTWLDLLQGIAHFMSRVKHSFTVKTAYVNAAIDGTEFTVRVDDGGAEVTVMEGQVVARNKQGVVRIESGQSTRAVAGQAPVVQLAVQLRDTVHWALYYPSVLSFDSAVMHKDLAESIAAFRRGDLPMAFLALSELDARRQDAGFHLYRATLNLSVGQHASALADIDRAIDLEAENPQALALKSVIATVQGERDNALKLAQWAITADARKAGPRIALSYALQARFELEQARQSMRTAVDLEPSNPVAWARLAELELMHRDMDRATQAAHRAVELEPGIALSRTTLGFAHLVSLDIEAAKASFKHAIELDQAAPLPRLGLGLALIREGGLEAGRRMLETAANLDPGNALIRSYLGKAYYEERRNDLASEQFSLAKAFDPHDPTAWFYDSILLQSENRPVEALQAQQQAVALNDNRGIYRSRQLLDQDEATRSVVLGRLYRDLGFEPLVLSEGVDSLHKDPANYTAHRLLADAYAALPRHEIARSSELLQAQLLQPGNQLPIQPQLAETGLTALESIGPADISYNEYSPLFMRNGVATRVSGLIAGNDTLADELILSGLQERFSFSLGQYHYESDGFRANNDIDYDLYNVYGQVSLSPDITLQAEYKYLDTEYGDLELRFDPDVFFPGERNEWDRHSARVGLTYRVSPESRLIVNTSYVDSDKTQKDSIHDVDDLGIVTDAELSSITDSKGYNLEAQFITTGLTWNAVSGVNRIHQDVSQTSQRSTYNTFPLGLPYPPGFPFPIGIPVLIDEAEIAVNDDIDFNNVYLYGYWEPNPLINATLAVSYDDYDDGLLHQNRFNPKAGITVSLPSSTKLRAAYIQSVVRPFLLRQALEPTQVNGFNQLFDDPSGSEVRSYGLALEQRFSPTLYAGVEFFFRDLDIVLVDRFDRFIFPGEQTERQQRAYLYWTPFKSLSLSSEYYYETIDRDIAFDKIDVRTHQLPLQASWIDPAGFFFKFKPTYIKQKIRSDLQGSGEDDFIITDVEAGYRILKQRGSVRLGVKNVFDEEFQFRDSLFNSSDPEVPQFQPERTLYLQLTLAF
ncbi:MAG: FecR domain-containing protein [Gammaproteobacteria bacterium]|nr:FecR domain-containing protein [Gammaproteobacteria bacterium]